MKPPELDLAMATSFATLREAQAQQRPTINGNLSLVRTRPAGLVVISASQRGSIMMEANKRKELMASADKQAGPAGRQA